jgi:hypothetical protein
MSKPTPSPAVIQLRAALAWAEENATPASAPFALIPYADAIAAGIPFSVTFSHEGNDWAVFIMGDATPEETEALEQSGVLDDADDLRIERHERAARFWDVRHGDEENA